jgi:DNA-binding CsgD family transcriptional regulator
VIGFYAYAWLLTDPETTVGCAPLADVPCLSELPRLIRLKYVTDTNRWTSLTGPALLADGELPRSLLWRDLLAGYGVTDIASVVFTDRFGCWGFLDLWRSGDAARFGPADVAFLAGILEPVTAALRRCQANTFVAQPAAGARGVGPVVLLLSSDLEVLGQTPETREYLRVLVPPSEGHAPVPASAYNVAAQLVAAEADVDQHPPVARVHLSGGVWVTLRAARIGQDIAVTIEETTPAARVSLFTRAFGLSSRETELLGHLVAGADTRQVAARMFLAENTVQDHLKSVFAKTAVHSRRALLARVLGA